MNPYEQFQQQLPVGMGNSKRDTQKAFIQHVKRTDSRFGDLSDAQAGNALAQLTGDPGLGGLDQGGINGMLASASDKVTNALNFASPSTFGLDSTKPFSVSTGEAAGETAKFFGAGDDTVHAFQAGGEQIPMLAGLLGVGAVGAGLSTIASPWIAATAVGLEASQLALMYGQGINMAEEKGVTGARATAAGGAMLAGMGATKLFGRAIADKAGSTALKLIGGDTLENLTGTTAKAATELTGSEAMKLTMHNAALDALGNPIISTLRKGVVKTTQEAMIAGAASAMSISSAVAGQVILDPKGFIRNQIASKDFWIPTLMGETFNGIGGVMMGRMREPIKSMETLRTEQAEAKKQLDQAAALNGAIGSADELFARDLTGPEQGFSKYNPVVDAMKAQQYGYATDPLSHEQKARTPEEITQDVLKNPHKLVGQEVTINGEKVKIASVDGEKGTVNYKNEVGEDVTSFAHEIDSESVRSLYPGEMKEGNKLPSLLDGGLSLKMPDGTTPVTKDGVTHDPALQVYPMDVKLSNDIYAGPMSDFALLQDGNARQHINVGNLSVEAEKARTATTLPDGTVVPSVDTKAVPDKATVLSMMADPLRVLQTNVHNQVNGVEQAKKRVNKTIKNKAPTVTAADAVKTDLANVTAKASADAVHREHRVDTESGNYVVFHNPGTKQVGVHTEIMRVGADGLPHPVSTKRVEGVKGTGIILAPEQMLSWAALDAGKLKNVLDEHYGVPLSAKEFEALQTIVQRNARDVMEMPLGISFHDDYMEQNSKLAAGMVEFVHRIGLQNALIRMGARLRFSLSNAKITSDQLNTNTFDYLSAKNRATQSVIRTPEGKKIFVISRNPSYSHLTDVHELGHVIHAAIDAGGYGEATKKSLNDWLNTLVDPKAEWNKLVEDRFLHTTRVTELNAAKGAEIANDILKLGNESYTVDPVTQRKYYLRRNELVAQLFQGVMNEPKGKFASFMKEHYKPVYDLFTAILSKFGTKGAPKSLDIYSPGYVTGRTIIKGMLDGHYEKTADHAAALKKVLASVPDLHPRVVETLVHAWYDNITPDMHEVLTESIKQTHAQLATQADIYQRVGDLITPEEQITAIQNLRNLHDDAPNGFADMANEIERPNPATILHSMPWTGMLLKTSHILWERLANAGKSLNDRMKGEGVKTNVAVLDRTLFSLTPEEAAVKLGFVSDTPKHAEMVAYLAGRERLLRHYDSLQETIRSLFTRTNTNKTSLEDVTQQTRKLDDIMRDWFLGRLPYQNGLPMHEPGMAIKEIPLERPTTITPNEVTSEILDARARLRAKTIFPELTKVLSDAITKYTNHPKGALHEDDTFTLSTDEDAGKSKKPRKMFKDALSAMQWKEDHMYDPAYDGYSMYIEALDNIAGTRKKDTEKRYGIMIKDDGRRTEQYDRNPDNAAAQQELIDRTLSQDTGDDEHIFDATDSERPDAIDSPEVQGKAARQQIQERVRNKTTYDKLTDASKKLFNEFILKEGSRALNDMQTTVKGLVEQSIKELLFNPTGRFASSSDQAQLRASVEGMRVMIKKNENLFRALTQSLGLKISPSEAGIARLASEYSEQLCRQYEGTASEQLRQRYADEVKFNAKLIDFADGMYLKPVAVSKLAIGDAERYEGAIKTFFENVRVFAKNIATETRMQSYQEMAMGKIPSNNFTSGAPEALHGFSALEDEIAANNAHALSATQNGALTNSIVNAPKEKGIISRIFGKTVGGVQTVHNAIGAGVLHLAAQDPNFHWAGRAFYDEAVNISGNTNSALSMLTHEGTLVNPGDGSPSRFVLNPDAIKDPQQTFKKILSNPKLNDLYNRIKLLEGQQHDYFESMLKPDYIDKLKANTEHPLDDAGAKVLAQQIKEIQLALSPADAALMENGLKRSYAACRRRAEVDVVQHMKNFSRSTATSLMHLPDFGNSADRAIDFATRFAHLSNTEERAKLLVKELTESYKDIVDVDGNVVTGMDRAMEFATKYGETEGMIIERNRMILNNSWYTSEVRYDPWHVRVVFNRGAGKTENGYYGFKSSQEAQQFVDKMRAAGHKANAPYDFSRAKEQYQPMNGTLENSINAVTERTKMTLGLMLEGKGVPEDLIQTITNVVGDMPSDITMQNESAKVNKSSEKKRHLVAGREALDMFAQGVQGVRRSIAAGGRRETDIMFKLYADDTGTKANWDLYRKLSDFKDGMRIRDTDYQRKVGMVGFSMMMLGNVGSSIMEIAQGPMTIAPMLLNRGGSLKDAYVIPTMVAKDAFRSAIARLHQGGMSGIWKGQEMVNERADMPKRYEELELIRYADRADKLANHKHHDINISSIERLVDGYRNLNQDLGMLDKGRGLAEATFNTLNNFYGYFNRTNMEISLISSYRMLKKQKYGASTALTEAQASELRNEAMMISDMANGNMQRLGRPGFFNTKMEATRNMASTYWSLQSFTNAMVANQLLYMQQAINYKGKFSAEQSHSGKKAMVALLGTQLLAMGMSGLTLWPTINKEIVAATGLDVDDEIKDFFFHQKGWSEGDKQFYSDFAAHGLPYAMGFPVDFGTRMGVSGIGPLNEYQGFDAKQLGGPVVGLISQAVTDIRKRQVGTIGNAELALNLLPTGFRRGLRMEFLDNGQVKDGNKQFMFDPTLIEKIGMWTGFNTVRAKEEMEARMKNVDASTNDSRMRLTQHNAIIHAMALGDIQGAQKIMNDTATMFNTTPEEVAKSTADLAVSNEMGHDVRQGTGPEATRIAQMYSLLHPAENLKRLERTADYMQTLGVQPRISPMAFVRAQGIDALTRNNPGMTSGAAGKVFADPAQKPTVFNMIDPSVGVGAALRSLLPH